MSLNQWLKGNKDSKVIHILVWIILFCLPVIFSLNNAPDNFFSYLRDWFPLLFSGVIFYLNYLIFINWYLFKANYLTFILINLVLIALTTWLTFLSFDFFRSFIDNPSQPDNSPHPPLLLIFFRIASSQLLTVAVAIAIKSTSRWYQTEQRQKQLEQEHLESELTNLKNQLNPHFFFNTLNNIYSLIAIDQDRAQEVVLHLSKMMRYHLYESNSAFVPLSREIDFINYYIELMGLRLSDHVKVTRTIDVPHKNMQIAPLLFITLVENAFKHGVSATANSEIALDLNITAGNVLTFSVKNTAFPKKEQDLSGSGIGLKNLIKRLNLLYPNRHTFTQKLENNIFESTLTLQL